MKNRSPRLWAALGAALTVLMLPSATAASQTVGREAPDAADPTNCVPNGVFIQRTLDSGETASWIVPSDGVLVQWSTRVGTGQSGTSARLEAWRHETGDTFIFVGASDFEPMTNGELNTNATRIPVQQGDEIAIHTGLEAGGPCIYDTASKTDNGVGYKQYSGGALPDSGDEGNLPVNNTEALANVSAVLEPDADNDGYGDESQDNCVGLANPTQVDTDHDDHGNACDADDDGDGFPDSKDALPLNPNEHSDADHDGKGDNADKDDDNDGLSDGAEKARGTNRLDRDSDDDGLLDGAETKTSPR